MAIFYDYIKGINKKNEDGSGEDTITKIIFNKNQRPSLITINTATNTETPFGFFITTDGTDNEIQQINTNLTIAGNLTAEKTVTIEGTTTIDGSLTVNDNITADNVEIANGGTILLKTKDSNPEANKIDCGTISATSININDVITIDKDKISSTNNSFKLEVSEINFI